MATKKTTEEKAAVTEAKEETKQKDTVKIKLFRDEGKYKDPLFVQINGRSFLIKRGEPVTVPVEVAAVVNQSLMQDGHAAQLIRGLTSKPQDMGQM